MKNYELKITGSGTQEEIVKALRDVADNIMMAGSSRAQGVTDELDSQEWEDATLVTSIEEGRLSGTMSDPEYILGQDSDYNFTINGIVLNEKARQEQLHEYEVVERSELITSLIGWIAESNKDSALMQQDLEMLMGWEDEFILSSISTNAYIKQGDSEFDENCKELLELNETL